jgi:hypothetical protein
MQDLEARTHMLHICTHFDMLNSTGILIIANLSQYSVSYSRNIPITEQKFWRLDMAVPCSELLQSWINVYITDIDAHTFKGNKPKSNLTPHCRENYPNYVEVCKKTQTPTSIRQYGYRGEAEPATLVLLNVAAAINCLLDAQLNCLRLLDIFLMKLFQSRPVV